MACVGGEGLYARLEEAEDEGDMCSGGGEGEGD
jgi:hypothetical protein